MYHKLPFSILIIKKKPIFQLKAILHLQIWNSQIIKQDAIHSLSTAAAKHDENLVNSDLDDE